MTSPAPSHTPAAGRTPASRPTRLRHEYIRAVLALLISTPLTVVLSLLLGFYSTGQYFSLPATLLSWVFWSMAYALLTWIAFGRSSADQLPSLVSTRRVRTWHRVVAGGADGPGLAVQFAALALGAAALLPRIEALAPATDEGVALTVVIVATVVTSWIVATLSYAVHYARVCIDNGGGLHFPGDEPPSFVDYLYFSASVGATFGTTDVDVTSTRLRRVVTGQAVLMLVFNTVIVSLTVSALIA